MDNPSYEDDQQGEVRAANGQPLHNGVAEAMEQDKKKRSPTRPMRKMYKRLKSQLQASRITGSCLPPKGEVATTLTLIFTIFAIFLSSRAVLGPIAGIGGTIFALLMLILVALVGGKLVLLAGWIIARTCKVEIRLPPLLGMLIVGILLKNIPYNFGQFGRAECTADHRNASLLNSTFLDSIHELDRPEDHGSWKRSVPDWPPGEQAVYRMKRSLEVDYNEDSNRLETQIRLIFETHIQSCAEKRDCFVKHQPGVAGSGWLQPSRSFLST